jgi:putative hydrolase of HD superfamily
MTTDKDGVGQSGKGPHQGGVAGAIQFLVEFQRLKALPRTGWLLRGIRDVESVAAHTCGVAITAMVLADLTRARGQVIDGEAVLRMALLHDLTEARMGDLPSTIKPLFDPGVLRQAEERAAGDLLAPLGRLAAEYQELWVAYEERQSLEARIVKAADKLDLLLQAVEYEQGGACQLAEFWERADQELAELAPDAPPLRALLAEWIAALRSLRPDPAMASA